MIYFVFYNVTLYSKIGNRTSDIVYFLKYSGEPGNRGPDYNMTDVVESLAGSRLSKMNCLVSKEDCMDTLTTYDVFYNVRSRAKIDSKCTERISHTNPDENYECFDDYCLFDLQQDPCEFRNVAKQNQHTFNMTIGILEQFKKELIKQNDTILNFKADPRYFDGYWETWMDSSGSDSSQGHRTGLTISLTSIILLFYLTV